MILAGSVAFWLLRGRREPEPDSAGDAEAEPAGTETATGGEE
jgi:hypothetical protein